LRNLTIFIRFVLKGWLIDIQISFCAKLLGPALGYAFSNNSAFFQSLLSVETLDASIWDNNLSGIPHEEKRVVIKKVNKTTFEGQKSLTKRFMRNVHKSNNPLLFCSFSGFNNRRGNPLPPFERDKETKG